MEAFYLQQGLTYIDHKISKTGLGPILKFEDDKPGYLQLAVNGWELSH